MAQNQVRLLNFGTVRRDLHGNVKSKVKFKFRVGDRVHIRKSKRTFKKGYLPNWTEGSSLFPKELPKSV